MKKLILLVVVVLLVFSVVGNTTAGEYGSVYVWYAGDEKTGAPPDQIVSEKKFSVGRGEFIQSVTVVGYGDMVKRLKLVFQDSKRKTGETLVLLSRATIDVNGNFSFTYMCTEKQRWTSVSLEYDVPNFNIGNRDYTQPALFWIDNVTVNKTKDNTYYLEPPADVDDIVY